MAKLLVHSCCAPCSVYCIEQLIAEGFEPILYFYNPNIFPQEEYNTRLNELLKFAKNRKIETHVDEDFEGWREDIKGFEEEQEGGKRCTRCFLHRLEKTAKKATELNIKTFTTTLTISPHKNSKLINALGNDLSKHYDVDFIERNFKKNDGFKKTMQLSKELNFYRQNYCGCKYSIK